MRQAGIELTAFLRQLWTKTGGSGDTLVEIDQSTADVNAQVYQHNAAINALRSGIESLEQQVNESQPAPQVDFEPIYQRIEDIDTQFLTLLTRVSALDSRIRDIEQQL